MPVIKQEKPTRSLKIKVNRAFNHETDEVHVFVNSNLLEKYNEEIHDIYTIYKEKELVGIAFVESYHFQKVNEREQLENKEKVVGIIGIQIKASKQGEGYGRELVEYIEGQYNVPITLQSHWKAYNFWRFGMGYEPIEKDDEDDQTWLFKKNIHSKNSLVKKN